MDTYIARICWNSKEWQHPTGEAAKYEAQSYVARSGYGHEEWLLNFDWTINGWCYGFLQPVNKNVYGNTSLVDEKINLFLYTKSPEHGWVLVGKIRACEIINSEQDKYARKIFQKRGWFKQMAADVERIKKLGYKAKKLDFEFNVRFRPESFQFLYPYERFRPKSSRYQLMPLGRKSIIHVPQKRYGTTKLKSTKTTQRAAQSPAEYDPLHNRLQNHLFNLLRNKYGKKAVVLEEDAVDIKVKHARLFAYFEVKSNPDARLAIREALGQLLEYAYYPRRAAVNQKNPRLFIAGPATLTEDAKRYLQILQKHFGITARYLQINLETATINL